jgi:uncharacterized membrane protein
MEPSIRQQKSSLKSISPGLGSAAVALIGCSLIGQKVDTFLPSCGIAVTLLLAAILSNTTSWIPTVHPLYDLCWTIFLPASLTLLLLARNEMPIITENNISTTSLLANDETSIAACIKRVSVPFVVASLGSLLGCWTSYQCARTFHWFSPDNAKSATACLSASYVGGSVNFFATARLINANAELLGSLATADLLTMALYFTFLSISLDWKWLRSKFRGSSDEMTTVHNTNDDLSTSAETNEDNGSPVSIPSQLLASIPLLSLTYLIVHMANAVEAFLGKWIPGTACAVIALVAPIVNSLVNKIKWWRPFSKVAKPIADFLFLSFFASIGIGSNLKSALHMGPACLIFSGLALSIHVLISTFGSMLWKNAELEDVWIASNAAIGGPATAAAFCCNRLTNPPEKLRGRTMAATFFGVGKEELSRFLHTCIHRCLVSFYSPLPLTKLVMLSVRLWGCQCLAFCEVAKFYKMIDCNHNKSDLVH